MTEKKWTIMIYASGNNEIEPEIWQSKLDIEKVSLDGSYNILIQLGRVDRKLVEIIRPYDTLYQTEDKWTGVRRYCYENNAYVLVKDLGRLNMASPHCLYDFISWCVEKYPAEKYMLIMSGHVYQLVGAITDYSQDRPYIMGIPGISNSLQLLKSNNGRNIDLLILDVCYFNYIEVIYEFAKYKNNAVKNILTYIYDGPLAGLPYNKIIETVQEYGEQDIREIIKKIIETMKRKLVAFNINHWKLERIKGVFDRLARQYLNIEDKPNLIKFINEANKNAYWYKEVKKLQQSLRNIVLYYKIPSGKNKNLINVAQRLPVDQEKILLYKRLAFNRGNAWFNVINKNFSGEIVSGQDLPSKLKPTILTHDALRANIKAMNPDLEGEKIKSILKTLLTYKGWDNK